MKRSSAEIRRIENALMNGKPIRVEPMSGSVVPPSLPIDISASETTIEDRRKIAHRIVELSDRVLSPYESASRIALRIGSPPNCNTISVSKRYDRVSFFIRSEDLRRRAEAELRAERFKPERLKSEAQRDKDRYRCSGLRLEDIEAHEALFREIVKESVSVVMDRRARRN
jgi:hypothetical protein